MVTASTMARYRLSLVARRLGTVDPGPLLGSLLDRGFELPAGDPRYGNNSLTPGHFPLEQSFSELEPDALRFTLQPLGPTAGPQARRDEVSRVVRRMVRDNYGSQALHWFDLRSEAWRGSQISSNADYGAWFGAAVTRDGLRKVKAYYEMAPEQVDALPPNLQYASRLAMKMLPGLVPIFTSVACGRSRGSQRVYLFHRGELRLLDLEPIMNRLGVGHQLPSVLTSLGLILGGRFVLPHGSTVIGLRDTPKGMEMKLEVLLAGFPDPPSNMGELVHMNLSRRPESLRALKRWVQASTPDDHSGPGQMSVLSVRVRPDMGSRLNIYFRPVGYDRPPTRDTRGRTAFA